MQANLPGIYDAVFTGFFPNAAYSLDAVTEKGTPPSHRFQTEGKNSTRMG